MMKALCTYKKNAKEEIKEKLVRSASKDSRRCPGSMRYFQKTGVLKFGEAKNSTSQKKRILNLKFEKKKKNLEELRSPVSGIRARSAVRRGECLKVINSVQSEKMEAAQEIDICKYIYSSAKSGLLTSFGSWTPS